MTNFGLIGAAGYIAPRHMQAIRDTDGNLLAAIDPHDCVGQLDGYFPDCRFFTEIERFDRYIEKLRRGPEQQRLDYISICTPNYLHDAHVRLALRVKANAICEKPLVISPWNLDPIEELEDESGRSVYGVLQLRLLPSIIALKKRLAEERATERPDICLTYVTRRGRWYDVSWKGQQEKSGGVAMNIGIHFFDLLLWLFGQPECSEVHLRAPNKMAGMLELERARVRWFLSTDVEDLPSGHREAGKFAYRSMTMNGEEIEFTEGFTDLHTKVYQEILAGRGTRISDARPSIETVFAINHSPLTNSRNNWHPQLDHTIVRDTRYARTAA